MLKNIAASIYDAQRFVLGAIKHERHVPDQEKKFQKAYHNMVINHAKHWRSYTVLGVDGRRVRRH